MAKRRCYCKSTRTGRRVRCSSKFAHKVCRRGRRRR